MAIPSRAVVILRFLLHYLTDLHDAGNISVVSLVGDEIGSGGGKRALEISQRAEEEMSDCVVRRWRSGRKAADATVDLSTDETSGSQQFARKLKMRAKIIVPVETRAWGSGIHDTEPDHGEEDITPEKDNSLPGFGRHWKQVVLRASASSW